MSVNADSSTITPDWTSAGSKSPGKNKRARSEMWTLTDVHAQRHAHSDVHRLSRCRSRCWRSDAEADQQVALDSQASFTFEGRTTRRHEDVHMWTCIWGR